MVGTLPGRTQGLGLVTEPLLADLGTLCKNRVRLKSQASSEFYLLTQPTAHQQRAFDLLAASPSV